MGLNDINSLSHTRWNCKYHIVFAPKYRRKVFYGEKRAAIGKILRQLCEWKGVKIIEAEACPNHIHLFVEIPPKMSVSHFMGYLKGKSSTMLYEQFGELKYKYRNREFWCRGYYVDTVGKNESLSGHGRKFCVSGFRQTQEYRICNVHDRGVFPFLTGFPGGWAVCAPLAA